MPYQKMYGKQAITMPATAESLPIPLQMHREMDTHSRINSPLTVPQRLLTAITAKKQFGKILFKKSSPVNITGELFILPSVLPEILQGVLLL